METFKLPALVNTQMSPEELIGPFYDLLFGHYKISKNFTGLKEDEFDKKMKSFGDDNRRQCAMIYNKLYQHGYSISGIKKGKLTFGMAARLPGKNQIEIIMDHSDEKKTPIRVGKYRFRIVMMVYNKEISVEDGLAYQSMSNEAIVKLFESGELR